MYAKSGADCTEIDLRTCSPLDGLSGAPTVHPNSKYKFSAVLCKNYECQTTPRKNYSIK